jgi:glycosyltransferase involved in cell wall biosynthesis
MEFRPGAPGLASPRIPSVSVALCTFNGERFVEEQLRSILAQDLPAMEVVVCDDGSTDATLSIVRAVAAESPEATPIRLVHTDRVGGVTRNFDRAIAACRGDIIALSDQDDRWDPHRLRMMVPLFAGDAGPTLVFADAALIDARGETLSGTLQDGLLLSRWERARIDGGRPFDALIRRNVVTGAACAFTRDLYELATPFPDSWVHDEWLAILAAASGRVVRSSEVLGAYRLHGSNQIGLPGTSVRARLTRMLAPRGDRYVRIRDRSATLVAKLSEVGAPDWVLALARRKEAFESARASYPAGRLGRVLPVLGRWVRGDYRRLSSQGGLDVVRDLAQPE